MDNAKIGSLIYRLRKENGYTQLQLAEILNISDKTVSKWERAQGCPDISLLKSLSEVFGVDMEKLLAGELDENKKSAGNMRKMNFYICPVCGNIIHSVGEAVISCCGITLPPLESEEADEAHRAKLERIEDEWYIEISHEMSKSHYISFIAYVTSDKFELTKLYPEGNAETRFKVKGMGHFYFYCNRHGLMKVRI